MKVSHGIEAVDALDLAAHGDSIESRSAVLVGVFDGVHLGHQRLLHELLELAAATASLPTVVTFRNHPAELVHGRPVDWIIDLPYRLRLLRRAGVLHVAVLDFDEALRNLDAAAFTQRVLVRGLRSRGLLLGYDTAIGKNREGSPDRMRALGNTHGFEVREGTALEIDSAPVSSTRIRNAIRTGDLSLAHRMLGRWPSALGKVIHGAGRGRTIGYPTANISIADTVLPPDGVYAVEILHDGDTHPGVANLGIRPTFDQPTELPAAPLEVHIFDFTEDLYDATLEVAFVAHLRGQQKFDNADALRAQIDADAQAARRALDR